MSIKPKVALSQDFLLNLARLPATVQGKVLKWAIRFQTDPATMHRAKGLEFQNVIVTSITVGQGARGGVTPQLIYMALTRAKQRAALLTS